eukprot:754423-Hanusia_phi.AAC.4
MPMKEVLNVLTKYQWNFPFHSTSKLPFRYPIKTRLSLTGTLVVARDIAHAKVSPSLVSFLRSLLHFSYRNPLHHLIFPTGLSRTF